MMEATTTQRQVTYGGLGWAVEGMGEVGPVLMPRASVGKDIFSFCHLERPLFSPCISTTVGQGDGGEGRRHSHHRFLWWGQGSRTRPAKSAGDARRVPPTGYSPVE